MYRVPGRRVGVSACASGRAALAEARTPASGRSRRGKSTRARTGREAAKREFAEELGLRAQGAFVELAPITQKSGKIVHAWAFAGDCDPSRIKSNTFSMEWPPHSGRTGTFPEVDRAAFFDLEQAKVRILPAQVPLLEELTQMLGRGH